MKRIINSPLPAPKIISYEYNSTTLRYEVTQKPNGFDNLPDELIKSKANEDQIKRYASHVIQSPVINGKKKFHTMIERVMPYTNVFTGDDGYQKENKSLILFIFSPSEKRLIVYFFDGYYPKTKKKKKEVMTAHLKKLENE